MLFILYNNKFKENFKKKSNLYLILPFFGSGSFIGSVIDIDIGIVIGIGIGIIKGSCSIT